MNLPDRYRPKEWSDLAGHADVLGKLESFRQRGGLAGRGYYLDGASGIGKSSIVELIAAEVAPDWATERLHALALTPAKLREIARNCAYRPIGRGVCYIVNEAQGLTKEAVQELLTMFDNLPEYVTWIISTMKEGQKRLQGMEDGSALIDRMTRFHLEPDIEAFARKAKEIAQREGLDGQPLSAYHALLLKYRGSLRAALQAVEGGAMLTTEKPAEPEPPEPDEPPRSPVSPSKPSPPKAPRSSAPAEPIAGWRQITARLGGRCIRCGETVKPGETIGHNQQVGVLCPACWKRKNGGN